MDSQKFCLKWDGFQSSVTSVFDVLRVDSELVDVTLCCEGQRVRAHRMMLSACSPYFRELFKDLPCQQLVIFLKDTSAADLTSIVEFMYKGSVNVSQSQLASFIKTAEMLQVQGLSGGEDAPPSPAPPPPPRPPPEPPRAWSQPASPAGSLRRATDAASPAEPRHKRRRADIPPHVERRPSPPPPGAGTVGAPHPPPLEEHAAQDATQALFESAAVKVEKFDVDLTLDDEDDNSAAAGGDGSLEAALGSVSQYEGYDPGSDQSLSADGQMFGAGSDSMGAGGPYTPGTPGTSQRTGSGGGGGGGAEDGSQGTGGGPFTCNICGGSYVHRRTLTEHMKKHTGKTTCPLCHQQFTIVYAMRRHLVLVHGLAKEEVDRMTNKRTYAPMGDLVAVSTTAATSASTTACSNASGADRYSDAWGSFE